MYQCFHLFESYVQLPSVLSWFMGWIHTYRYYSMENKQYLELFFIKLLLWNTWWINPFKQMVCQLMMFRAETWGKMWNFKENLSAKVIISWHSSKLLSLDSTKWVCFPFIYMCRDVKVKLKLAFFHWLCFLLTEIIDGQILRQTGVIEWLLCGTFAPCDVY